MAGGFRKRTWSDKSVRLIRELFADEQIELPEISERFGTEHLTVRKMLTGRSYARAGGPLAERDDPRVLTDIEEPKFSDQDVRRMLLAHDDDEFLLCDSCGDRTTNIPRRTGEVYCDECKTERSR